MSEETVKMAAERMERTEQYVTSLLRAKKLRGRMHGRDWIVESASVDEWIATPRRRGPKSKKDVKA